MLFIRRYDSQDTKRRILAASALLFLEKGYTDTRLAEILKQANVSASSFQNIFRTKDGVLTEFVSIMFDGQFERARMVTRGAPSPAHIYAAEIALQLTLTEMNENLRDLYLEAYTYPDAMDIIHRGMVRELQAAFSPYLPACGEGDFYEIELGTSGIMRSFMARKCDMYFTLERKIRRFLDMALRIFRVPEEEQRLIIAYTLGLDLAVMARHVMDSLFQSLSICFDLNRQEDAPCRETLSS